MQHSRRVELRVCCEWLVATTPSNEFVVCRIGRVIANLALVAILERVYCTSSQSVADVNLSVLIFLEIQNSRG